MPFFVKLQPIASSLTEQIRDLLADVKDTVAKAESRLSPDPLNAAAFAMSGTITAMLSAFTTHGGPSQTVRSLANVLTALRNEVAQSEGESAPQVEFFDNVIRQIHRDLPKLSAPQN